MSRATLIRDLNRLIDIGLVRSEGGGRSVVYGTTDRHTLFYPMITTLSVLTSVF